MQKMGRVDSGWEVFDSIGDIDVTFELISGATGIKEISNAKVMDKAYTLNGQLTLKHIQRIEDYGEYSFFPVFGGMKSADGKYQPGKPHRV